MTSTSNGWINSRASMEKIFIVEQHDQGRTDEVDTWPSKREALARIREIEADYAEHPHWYRHLANPCWMVREAIDRSYAPFMHYS